jgi:hypothetical protein
MHFATVSSIPPHKPSAEVAFFMGSRVIRFVNCIRSTHALAQHHTRVCPFCGHLTCYLSRRVVSLSGSTRRDTTSSGTLFMLA